ncbi:hypothetical protein BaRGS_00002397 [Batillaria attramentaria]|uniref:Uncharacterized protein n=1 Tax=Batillaria attramentaria TaxID=370345 RepID=A0ABD0M309_9CAEN
MSPLRERDIKTNGTRPVSFFLSLTIRFAADTNTNAQSPLPLNSAVARISPATSQTLHHETANLICPNTSFYYADPVAWLATCVDTAVAYQAS